MNQKTKKAEILARHMHNYAYNLFMKSGNLLSTSGGLDSGQFLPVPEDEREFHITARLFLRAINHEELSPKRIGAVAPEGELSYDVRMILAADDKRKFLMRTTVGRDDSFRWHIAPFVPFGSREPLHDAICGGTGQPPLQVAWFTVRSGEITFANGVVIFSERGSDRSCFFSVAEKRLILSAGKQRAEILDYDKIPQTFKDAVEELYEAGRLPTDVYSLFLIRCDQLAQHARKRTARVHVSQKRATTAGSAFESSYDQWKARKKAFEHLNTGRASDLDNLDLEEIFRKLGLEISQEDLRWAADYLQRILRKK